MSGNLSSNHRLLTVQTINLGNSNEMYYFGPMKVGADTTSMQVNFDTGSDWLWIPTPACTGCAATRKHTIASPDVNTTKTGSINYLDGSGVSGHVFNTTITLGSKVATQMPVLMVSSSTNFDTVAEYDGLCGLSESVLSTNAGLLVPRLFSQGQLALNMFSFSL